MTAKEIISQLLASADIQINGARPWDIQVHHADFYSRLLHDRDLGLGESYVEGWWDCAQIDAFIYRLLRAGLDRKVKQDKKLLWRSLLHRVFNYQTKRRAVEVAHRHYDIGNDLYRAMLGETMVYSCGYWKNAIDLDQAQRAKMELICQKLALQPGLRILDIGCGWGSLARYAAQNYGVEVVGITLSEKQQAVAKQCCQNLAVTIRLQDYRDLQAERFDRVVSVGMFEHVGYKNTALL